MSMKKNPSPLCALLLCILLLLPVSAPASAEEVSSGQTPSGIPYTRLGQEIDQYVNAHIGKSSPGAAIVVTKGDTVLFSKGYGYANVEKQIPVDPATTVFNYGSVNKLFVWTSVMQLVEEGKMKLDQEVKTFFPEEFAAKLRYDKPITMLDIMHHTAGFENSPFIPFTQSLDELNSLEETLLSAQPEQIYEPDKVISYSNFAASLAGLAVEKVSGSAFSDYEMDHILRPLGMNHTSGHPSLADHPDLQADQAAGYAVAEQGGFEARVPHYIPLYPAGAMTGTAEDLAQFAMALTSDHSPLFARQETLETMLAQSYPLHKDLLSNAHGFWEYNAEPRAVGHSGNTKGFSSEFAIVPEDKLGIVVLTNSEVEQDITSGVINLLLKNKSQETVAEGENLSPSSEVAGHYVLSSNTLSTIHEVIAYLGLIKVEAEGEYGLTLNVMGMSGEYKQTSPDIYKLYKTDFPRIQKLAPILYAEKIDGKITRLSKGKATDVLPLSPDRSVPVLIGCLSLAAVAIGFFVLTPFVLLIRWLLRRKKGLSPLGAAHRLFAAVTLCGTALSLNAIVLLLNVIGNEYLTARQLNAGIILNWILAGLAGLLLVLFILKSRKLKLPKSQKVFRIAGSALLVSFILLLANWNFFHLMQ
ncbi:beta-lactamase family protein [Paenibacillus albidus]|uniref:serine hydrolase domain-containing protein n=1 Tax=Paenibacillus albidus TaxID=2041023 RepID=UPI001BE822F9|nr:serine hydrolase domain-containing protein [Paenibacillus albidus]MBT2289529.1 beta-lactamase family protein [Paenibacillus albidus]